MRKKEDITPLEREGKWEEKETCDWSERFCLMLAGY